MSKFTFGLETQNGLDEAKTLVNCINLNHVFTQIPKSNTHYEVKQNKWNVLIPDQHYPIHLQESQPTFTQHSKNKFVFFVLL